ncbi:hypothetical protein [Flectobacillus sp. BAB-3569]|uniref:hypothetical protein n=1 Tax=Flectobacillus sp. BAB-3569 TaxID=1509483 RepID=UPI000BA4B14C|nr:hypothetical protein [Flectobacillus sp. BAB-3569]PAC30616.1 hypothetical protein BWI92_11310 [Flectobacillus sp. BAB-3569]
MENMFVESSTDTGIDFRVLLTKYLRNWYLFVGFLLFAIGAVFLYTRYSPKVYQVSSVILIKDEKKVLMLGIIFLKI